jgi:hypothetical protein
MPGCTGDVVTSTGAGTEAGSGWPSRPRTTRSRSAWPGVAVAGCATGAGAAATSGDSSPTFTMMYLPSGPG